MALKLTTNYSKRLGLPGFSSHQYSVCVETEITNLDEVAKESAALYATLQENVDAQIQQTGFVPDETYGIGNRQSNSHGNGSNGSGSSRTNGANGHWQCTDKQRDLIEKIVRENNLDKNEVEQIAQDMFGDGVKTLNRLAASGLIDELLERYGNNKRETRSRPFTRGNGKAVRT